MQSARETGADTIVVGLVAGEKIPHDLPGGALSALRDRGEASDRPDRTALLHDDSTRYITVGLGPRAELTTGRLRSAAAAAAERAASLATRTLCWEVPHHLGGDAVAALVEGTLLRDYRFDRYRPAGEERRIERLIVSAHDDVSEVVHRAAVITRAQNRARDLGNTPANDLGPAALADYVRDRFAGLPGARVEILREPEIRQAGMGAFAAVAQGSEREALMIRIDLDGPGAPAGEPLVALIGKAVTFDSGGLSLKPPASMHEMKFDMLGGAAVIEALAALAELGAPVRALGLIGATENLPSGTAVRPGDIVRALDGTTIEVNNTDAEGRLVLADLICHAKRVGAERLIDLATLTGGVVIALGSTYAGLFANHDAWAERVLASAARTDEHLWRLPLHPEYAEMVKGRYAQLTNRTERREALATAGAEFLHHFAGETPWAHLDIAGTAYDVRRRTFADRGATGYGVRLIADLLSPPARS